MDRRTFIGGGALAASGLSTALVPREPGIEQAEAVDYAKVYKRLCTQMEQLRLDSIAPAWLWVDVKPGFRVWLVTHGYIENYLGNSCVRIANYPLIINYALLLGPSPYSVEIGVHREGRLYSMFLRYGDDVEELGGI